ncbi:MAG: hypothetical protein ACRYFU_08650 [Janthinobacterium lividum]
MLRFVDIEGDQMADSEQLHRSPWKATNTSWVSEEYEAGYWAGHHGIHEFRCATLCWRTGWQDAQRELYAMGASPFPMGEDHVPAQWSLYGTGAVARACNLPFDEGRSEPWKRSWIQADIKLEAATPWFKRMGASSASELI